MKLTRPMPYRRALPRRQRHHLPPAARPAHAHTRLLRHIVLEMQRPAHAPAKRVRHPRVVLARAVERAGRTQERMRERGARREALRRFGLEQLRGEVERVVHGVRVGLGVGRGEAGRACVWRAGAQGGARGGGGGGLCGGGGGEAVGVEAGVGRGGVVEAFVLALDEGTPGDAVLGD